MRTNILAGLSLATLAMTFAACGSNNNSTPTSATSTGGNADVVVTIVPPPPAPAGKGAAVGVKPTPSPSPTPTPAPEASFSPALAKVIVGQTVAWTNTDTVAHQVVDDHGAFDTGSIAPGATSTPISMSVGEHKYHDAAQPKLTGTIAAFPHGGIPAAAK